MTTDRAVVTLSGGQDSATCLAWAIEKWGRENVETVSFSYGQRHSIELACAEKIAEHFEVPRTILPLPALTVMADAALTNPQIPVEAQATAQGGNGWAASKGLPSTFVPGRNLIFLGTAAAFALPRNALNLVTGICAADEAGYPDCRPGFAMALEEVVQQAMDETEFRLHAPLLYANKAKTFELADQLGVLDFIVENTHTCYEGARHRRYAWGYGCAECPACETRERGWYEFREEHPAEPDPTEG